MSLNDLEYSLEESIGGDKILEITGEISEGLLDTLLESEILKNIPIFGTLYKAGQLVLAVKDRIFAKKVLKFLLEIRDINTEGRKKFLGEIEKESGQKAGEVLIMLLDKLDNMRKTKIIANLVRAKVFGVIGIEDFLRYSYIIEKGYFPDLTKLENFYNMRGYPKGSYSPVISESLYSLGLLDITHTSDKNDSSIFSRAMGSHSNNKFRINQIGCNIFKYGILGQIESEIIK